MRTKCGVEYEAGTERPADARFALWYLGQVKFYPAREEAEKALAGLSPAQREDATIGELENKISSQP